VSWEDLSRELGEMFDEYSWRADAMERAIEEWGTWRTERANERLQCPVDKDRRNKYQRAYRAARPHVRKAAVERTKKWREENRQRMRDQSREHNKKQRERAKTDPVYREKYLAMKRRAWRKQRDKNVEHYRALNREAAKRRRARKKELRMQEAA
jgi:hypothetical protein